jgi:hypothetical protein
MRSLLLAICTIVASTVLAADSSGFNWPGTSSTSTPWGATPELPGQSGFPAQPGLPAWPGSASPSPGGSSMQGFIPWSSPGGAVPDMRSAAPLDPGAASAAANLTGTWRGTGGELVEIRRNTARVWGSGQDYCMCIFMIHGDRLIAYSPDTDVVRKYQFFTDRDRFLLRDEDGQTMMFERLR